MISDSSNNLPAWFVEATSNAGADWFHLSSATNAKALLKNGITPWDEVAQGHRQQGEVMAPRPGHVYICSASQIEWVSELFNEDLGRRPDLVTLRVDLRAIEFDRLTPDEDVFITDFARAADYGLADPKTEVTGYLDQTRRRYHSFGEWARVVRLGEQEGVLEESFRYGRLAVRGTISPAALTLVES